MIETTPPLFAAVDEYIEELFAQNDNLLNAALANAKRAGLPAIQVSPAQGKFLYLVAKLIAARRILEIGTLGGYSTIWLARALGADGSLVTLEANDNHARVAVENIAMAGFASQVEVVVGPALDTLPQTIDRATEPFDLVFLDADKTNYTKYLGQIMNGVRSGSLILIDNVIRGGRVLAPREDDPSASAARSVNAALAADDRLESIVLQQVGTKGHDGIALARVR